MIERLRLRHSPPLDETPGLDGALDRDKRPGETPILIGRGALAEAAPQLAEWAAGRTLFVVSTPRVMALHGERLAGVRQAARASHVLNVAEGEAAKTVAAAGDLWQAMLGHGGKRDSRVLAFGGGSVGDLAGFAAGCFLRGVAFVQVPTTLLAQVDAAVGGKTGVDLPAGKNTVGLFHHPDLVVADTETLATLPHEELRSGLAEVVKKGAMLDAELFARVESELPRLLAGDPAALPPIVAGAVRAKAAVVERDPTEQGERRLLNFGHTLGHALESVGGYQGGLRHGEAVAYGMLFALRLAVQQGLDPVEAERIAEVLRRFELPPLRTAAGEEFALPPLLAAMARDKKAKESGLAWALPSRLGTGHVVTGIPLAAVESELAGFLARPFSPFVYNRGFEEPET